MLQSAALVAKLKFELAEAEDALSQDAHEAAHRNRVEAAEVHNLNVVIRALQEQNVEVQYVALEHFRIKFYMPHDDLIIPSCALT